MLDLLRRSIRRFRRPTTKRPGPDPAPSRGSISLQEFNTAQGTPLEVVLGIDALSVTNPFLPTAIPSELEMQLWIKAYLQECPEMFDEGTLDYLGPYLRSQEQLWLRASEVAEHDALTTAHRLRSVNDGHLQVAVSRLDDLQGERGRLAHEIDELTSWLDPERTTT